MRVVVTASLVLTLAAAAMLGDPEPEPALTKIGEFAHHIVSNVGPHR